MFQARVAWRAAIHGGEQDQLEQLAGAGVATATPEPENETARGLWRAAQSRSAIGTPDQIRAFLAKYEEAHQDSLLFVAQSGTRRHEDIMASLELFGRTVLPDFRERHETVHKPWRERQLQGFKYPVRSSV
jgi:alkanesulfonate monooxygenase SsuD/methylene tetrahydromethanopterin reductase-like flavin-dependent oxidoreductase (luciferase family)